MGQFALRGGILDVFSPLMDQPVRCEFFDDEIDSMGAFDPGTQRRTANVSSALLLPAAEVLPHCAPGGLPGLADQLTALAEKLAKKQKTEAIVQTLREDAERLGYNDADSWRHLVCACASEIARGYKIPLEHLRWYAAFHRKEDSVHIHMVIFYLGPPRKGISPRTASDR